MASAERAVMILVSQRQGGAEQVHRSQKASRRWSAFSRLVLLAPLAGHARQRGRFETPLLHRCQTAAPAHIGMRKK